MISRRGTRMTETRDVSSTRQKTRSTDVKTNDHSRSSSPVRGQPLYFFLTLFPLFLSVSLLLQNFILSRSPVFAFAFSTRVSLSNEGSIPLPKRVSTHTPRVRSCSTWLAGFTCAQKRREPTPGVRVARHLWSASWCLSDRTPGDGNTGEGDSGLLGKSDRQCSRRGDSNGTGQKRVYSAEL